ncbi:hypothetical protein OZN62_12180 [Aurantiacibacter sp. MUD11]|uniref:COG3650 family protein n=1 Tax=Aurantiacibacter sp. MUD11 TaxID=3003265 RepID=UPI0022AA9A1B|nr:hypothetical protein [Aurantiacibacter sp. MUD11]WAT19371.1 hypothetical protein OZN62_12180 [Aurantiacibacter sp. MUD11]
MKTTLAVTAILTLAACQQGSDSTVPGDASDTAAYAEIAEDELIRFTGTEPFWGGSVIGDRLTYSTPDNIDGTTIPVTRFAGRGGLSFSGALDGQAFDLAITPAECSDGMSDRIYPFVATLQIGSEHREGCATAGQ